MTEPERTPTVEERADESALALGRAVLGRDPTDVETTALSEIFRATAQALKHGFIRRLADHVYPLDDGALAREHLLARAGALCVDCVEG